MGLTCQQHETHVGMSICEFQVTLSIKFRWAGQRLPEMPLEMRPIYAASEALTKIFTQCLELMGAIRLPNLAALCSAIFTPHCLRKDDGG